MIFTHKRKIVATLLALAFTGAVLLFFRSTSHKTEHHPDSHTDEVNTHVISPIGETEVKNPTSKEQHLNKTKQSTSDLHPSMPNDVRRSSSAISKTESKLLNSGSLDQTNAARILKSSNFEKTVRDLADSSKGNPLASDLTELFANSLREKISNESENLNIQEFSCGSILCMGSISAPDSKAWNHASNELLNDKSAKIYAFIEFDVPQANGTIEHRIIFSTDPSSNGIILPFTAIPTN